MRLLLVTLAVCSLGMSSCSDPEPPLNRSDVRQLTFEGCMTAQNDARARFPDIDYNAVCLCAADQTVGYLSDTEIAKVTDIELDSRIYHAMNDCMPEARPAEFQRNRVERAERYRYKAAGIEACAREWQGRAGLDGEQRRFICGCAIDRAMQGKSPSQFVSLPRGRVNEAMGSELRQCRYNG